MKRFYFLFILVVFAFIAVRAQIGYQIAIIDPTSGSPKANENVTVSVTISDSSEATICSENHEVTTNEVGIATIQIGNANTFDDVDWNNLPLWVSAKVGDVVISRSQILNVPVAEYTKNYGSLTPNLLCEKKWITPNDEDGDYYTFTFYKDGTCKRSEIIYSKPSESSTKSYSYDIVGDILILYSDSKSRSIYFYSKEKDALVSADGGYLFF